MKESREHPSYPALSACCLLLAARSCSRHFHLLHISSFYCPDCPNHHHVYFYFILLKGKTTLLLTDNEMENVFDTQKWMDVGPGLVVGLSVLGEHAKGKKQ
jgi:hypothetical protein